MVTNISAPPPLISNVLSILSKWLIPLGIITLLLIIFYWIKLLQENNKTGVTIIRGPGQ